MSILYFILISFIVLFFAWNSFEWFSWSRSRSYRLSRWEYYKSKVSFTLLSYILIMVFTFLIVVTKDEKKNISNNTLQQIKHSDISSEESTHTNNDSPVSSQKAVNKESSSIKEYSDQEIFELEEKVQYHGDDPIIRSRLGLPLRNTQP